MIGCLVYDEKKVPDSLLDHVRGYILRELNVDFVKENQNMSIIMIQHTSKNLIWQVALEFEIAGIAVGYGFGNTSLEAKQDCFSFWTRRLAKEKHIS
ncbi:hypothetical protein [Aquibacillus salsiterrae]|uniref:Uncharacterized protein n=1 Tax=Aquibacillus salsiterrae TaxID=2950439 RepID=A0A9X3WGW1_9BACI|nr:hypothetical protein [Aquibacillus salsiterrae]MDC3418191.1 hypothetical protein [Aquibacillus salsiterrae]